MGGIAVTHIDDDAAPLFTGTHKGADAADVLSDPGADFISCGCDPDLSLLIKNSTDGSSGAVTAATEDTVTATLAGGTDNKWDNGDTYVILKTDTEDAVISTHYTDKRFGRKVTHKEQLEDGLFPGDRDLDEDGEDVFGPGQPYKMGE